MRPDQPYDRSGSPNQIAVSCVVSETPKSVESCAAHLPLRQDACSWPVFSIHLLDSKTTLASLRR